MFCNYATQPTLLTRIYTDDSNGFWTRNTSYQRP